MTAYAMTHSKLFAAGISGSPVTDWHNYDSIYTERYMNTPQENPDGYEKTSVVKAADKLHGRLLIMHGLMDENVHPQNTTQFIQALQRSKKDFQVMFYPQMRHGLRGDHYNRLMVDFIKQSLELDGAAN
jgi:dipeptidyl-peptidase-4